MTTTSWASPTFASPPITSAETSISHGLSPWRADRGKAW